MLDGDKLREVLKNEKIDLVIHCAALKAVGESVKNLWNTTITTLQEL